MVRQHHQLNGNLSKLWKTEEDRGAWSAAAHGITESGMT